MRPPDITVLCSLGQHPTSARARPAAGDCRALALALRQGGPVQGVHAGDSTSPALREFLGQTAAGRALQTLDVLELAGDQDIRPALIGYLKISAPDIVLTGSQAEIGPGSGMMAYDLAAALDCPVVPAINALHAREDGRYTLTQVLPAGRRRHVCVSAPFIASVDAGAAPRAVFAAARARRGEVRCQQPSQACPLLDDDVTIRPARARPKRIGVAVAHATASDRLRAASQAPSGQGRLMVAPEADEAAQAILDYLNTEGLLRR